MSEDKKDFKIDESDDYYQDIPPPPEEKTGYQPPEETSTDFGTQPISSEDTIIEPEEIDADLLKKKKRRKWILISIFGITLPILIIIGVVVFIFLSIIGAFETCAVNCCESCGESCANSCSETCCTSCSESCNNSCNDACSSSCDSACSGCSCGNSIKITATEKINNLQNILKWTIHSIFGFFFE